MRDGTKKIDMRVVKTRRDLCNALIELLAEYPMGSITVQEICEVALVNRMTFYKHYADKYDLLDDCVNAVKKQALQRIDKVASLENNAENYCKVLMATVVDVCYEKQDIIKRLPVEENVIAAARIKAILQSDVEALVSKLIGDKSSSLPISYLASFIVGGLYQAILQWLNEENPVERSVLIKALYPIFEENVKLLTSI